MLHVRILTPERLVYETDAESVTAPTSVGEITILPHHTAHAAPLRAGEIRVKKSDAEDVFAVSTGFIQTQPKNQVTILADTAEAAEELEWERIQEAKNRAKKMMDEKRRVDDGAFARAAAAMERELAREKVALKRRKVKRYEPFPVESRTTPSRHA